MIIWMASYPRSGNTFFRILVKDCLGYETYSVYGEEKDITPDAESKEAFGMGLLPKDKSLDDLRKEEKIYFIKTHERYESSMANDKIVYLIRDGREATESYHKYLQQFTKYAKTRYEIIAGQMFVPSWGNHAESWMQEKKAEMILVKYEDLVDKPLEIMKKISDFSGLSIKESNIPSFEQLKEKNPVFFRSGKKSSWKEKWNQDELAFFWYKNGKIMNTLGYADETDHFSVTDEKSVENLLGREFESLKLELKIELGILKQHINNNGNEARKNREYLQQEIKRVEQRNKEIENSYSYRLGRFLTMPFRMVLKIFR